MFGFLSVITRTCTAGVGQRWAVFLRHALLAVNKELFFNITYEKKVIVLVKVQIKKIETWETTLGVNSPASGGANSSFLVSLGKQCASGHYLG